MTSRTTKSLTSKILRSKRDSKTIDPMRFLSLVHIMDCMLQYCYLRFILLVFGFHTWLVMLSYAVLSAVQVFHLYDVVFGLCLSVRDVVSHPSRCDLTVTPRVTVLLIIH
jgi:hypothetical protein